MSIIYKLRTLVAQALQHLYQLPLDPMAVQVNDIKAEFAGEYAIVTFGLAKQLQQKPDEIATALSKALAVHTDFILSSAVVKGFLNITLQPLVFESFLNNYITNQQLEAFESNGKKTMIEYSSPNTNKPLHFGHLRNNFLGYSVANILKRIGTSVIKANLVNDRGIHICKSMVAWKHFAQGATPQTTGIKGDHLVGDYYVKYNDVYKQEVAALILQGIPKEEAEKKAPILLETQELLLKWEQGDEATLSLWKEMNNWVYEGFNVTYKKLGIDFDTYYYESNTYLLGKKMVEEGLQKGYLYQKEDNSIWIDLTDEGLDQKLLLRADGTSVYMTQDLGTANIKFEDYKMDTSVYVIADEQNYHMQVLQLILQKLQKPYANGIYHLSYGMVELPSGRMKSREGTVVDADDMIEEMIQEAKQNTEALGKIDGFSENELQELYNTLGLGALKFYLLRVDPKKKMIFNPKESIDFHGFTGPFIQYTHARICSILRKAGPLHPTTDISVLNNDEKNLLKILEQYQATIWQAANEYNPSVICNYIFALAKEFNSYLVQHSILKADTDAQKTLRLQIASLVKTTLADGLQLLGIQAPERM